MKTLTLIFLITINFSIYAQESIFVRVYNSSGTKISKGNVLIVTDSSLMLAEHQPNFIPVSSISYIKTNHSEGHNVLIGSAVCATAGIILGALSSNNSGIGPKIGALEVGIFGMAGGAGIGGLTILLKKSKTYFIEGDLTKWKSFQLMITGNNVK